jgi:hypothetical protein
MGADIIDDVDLYNVNIEIYWNMDFSVPFFFTH